MRILAIETSGRHGSVALLDGNTDGARLVDQQTLSTDERTAKTLAPTIHQILATAGWPTNSVELVAVPVGPGSFTGLRIGVTTIKTLAYALGAEVAGVDTLTVIASQAPAAATPCWATLYAQRNELFVARFSQVGNPAPTATHETAIIPQDDWLGMLAPGDHLTGPAVARLATPLPDGIHNVSDEHWQPTAAAVGQVAWHQYQSGHRDDPWKLVPIYYRPSAAEEKAARK